MFCSNAGGEMKLAHVKPRVARDGRHVCDMYLYYRLRIFKRWANRQLFEEGSSRDMQLCADYSECTLEQIALWAGERWWCCSSLFSNPRFRIRNRVCETTRFSKNSNPLKSITRRGSRSAMNSRFRIDYIRHTFLREWISVLRDAQDWFNMIWTNHSRPQMLAIAIFDITIIRKK